MSAKPPTPVGAPHPPFPVRVHLLVIQLANLQAKPVAKQENAHPMKAWSCQLKLIFVMTGAEEFHFESSSRSRTGCISGVGGRRILKANLSGHLNSRRNIHQFWVACLYGMAPIFVWFASINR